jgi:hypothetical protein
MGAERRRAMTSGTRDVGVGRRAVLLSVAGAALVVLLAGCSGGLFPSIVETGIEPQACGSSGTPTPRYFTAAPTRGAAPLAVAFSSKGDDVIEWRWTFGDGGTSSLPEPTHTYAVAGVYAVELTVVRTIADGSGSTVTEKFRRARYIGVTGRPDLVISSLAHTPDAAVPGTRLAFSVTVSNVGTAAAGGFYVQLFGAGPKTLARVPSLSPGASATVVLTLKMSQPTETFTARADSTSRIRELNEGNNEAQHVASATLD